MALAKYISTEDKLMQKLWIPLMSLVLLIGTTIPASAQDRYYRHSGRDSYAQRDDRGQRRRSAYDRNYDYGRNRYDDRSIWDKSRDKITTAGGALGGAAIGGAIGGTKGAVIGAILGGGGSALYTYKIRKKDNYRRRY
jgi:hypothetical protein